MSGALSRVTMGAPGQKANWTRAPLFIFHSQNQIKKSMSNLKRILLVEDNEKDRELTLSALEEFNIANEIVIAHDGADALDYLFSRGKYANNPDYLPVVVLLDLKMPKVDG